MRCSRSRCRKFASAMVERAHTGRSAAVGWDAPPHRRPPHRRFERVTTSTADTVNGVAIRRRPRKPHPVFPLPCRNSRVIGLYGEPKNQLNATMPPPTTTGNPIIQVTTLRASVRCSSAMVWPSGRRASIPGRVALTSEKRWPSEDPDNEGLWWASMGVECWAALRVFAESADDVESRWTGCSLSALVSLNGEDMDVGGILGCRCVLSRVRYRYRYVANGED